MEIKEILKFFWENIKLIALSGLFAGILGAVAYFFLPINYQAEGSLFIKRVIYPYSETHFTYEGYYGQQAAVSYTDSVIGLIESVDIRARALTKLGENVNDKNLRKLSRKVKVSKNGPQVITIKIKEASSDKAQETWQAVSDVTIETIGELKSGGDPYINLSKVSQEPVIKEGYRNLPLFTLLGIFIGVSLASFALAAINYFSKKKK
jgi:capsular polysaccharide biosynthesis protein